MGLAFAVMRKGLSAKSKAMSQLDPSRLSGGEADFEALVQFLTVLDIVLEQAFHTVVSAVPRYCGIRSIKPRHSRGLNSCHKRCVYFSGTRNI